MASTLPRRCRIGLVLAGLLGWAAAPSPAALLQLRGVPPRGGTVTGSLRLPLERAEAGETPVLTLQSPGGRLRLLLDTGAAATVLTPAAVDRLGLTASVRHDAELALAGGGAGCQQARPDRLELPPLSIQATRHGDTDLRLEHAEALVLPVQALPAWVDGVLAVASLRQLPFAIDPLASELRFGAAALADGHRPPRWRLPVHWRQGLPLLDLQAGSGAVPALADTGAEGVFVTASRLAQLKPASTPERLTLVGVCGQQPALRLQVQGLGFPGASPGALEVILTDNPIFRQLGVDVILGQELLKRHRQLWRLDLPQPRLDLR